MYKKISFNTKILIFVFIFGLFFEVIVFFRFPRFAWSEGMLNTWLTSNGLQFYKDFMAYNTPLVRQSVIVMHSIFGLKQWPTIILGLIRSMITLSLILYASMKLCKSWARIVPLIFYLAWDVVVAQNQFSPNGVLEIFILLSIINWLSWYKKPQKRDIFFMGFFGGLAVSSSQIILPFYVVMFLTITFITFKKKRNWMYAKLFLIGFLIPAIYVLLWLAMEGLLGDFYYWTVEYMLFHYPKSNMGHALDNKFIFFSIHSPLLLLIFPIISSFQKKKFDVFWKYLLLGIILIILPISFWFSIFHVIRFQISLAVFALLFGILIQEISTEKGRLRQIGIIAIIIIIGLNIYSFWKYAVPRYKKHLFAPGGRRIMTMLYKDDPSFYIAEWIRTNVPEGERLFIIADPMLYLESRTLPVNFRASNNLPFLYEPLDELGTQLDKNPPSYWVVDERIWERFHDFEYDHTTKFFKKILDEKEIVYQLEYITIRKN